MGGGDVVTTYLVICEDCDFRQDVGDDRLADTWCPNCGPLEAHAPPRPKPMSNRAMRRRLSALRAGENVGGFAVIRARPRMR